LLCKNDIFLRNFPNKKETLKIEGFFLLLIFIPMATFLQQPLFLRARRTHAQALHQQSIYQHD